MGLQDSENGVLKFAGMWLTRKVRSIKRKKPKKTCRGPYVKNRTVDQEFCYYGTRGKCGGKHVSPHFEVLENSLRFFSTRR